MVAPSVMAVSYPSCQKYVMDSAGVLTSAEIAKINDKAAAVETASGAEIGVATVKTLEGLSVEEYALNVFNSCGIGKHGKDNGVLILTAMDEHKWRIEVGYGLEGTINDAKAGMIGRDDITANFKQEKYGEGLYSAVDRIGNLIANNETNQTMTVNPDNTVSYISIAVSVTGVFLGLLTLIGSPFHSSSDSPSFFGDDDETYEEWAYPRICPFCKHKILKKELDKQPKQNKVCPNCGKPLQKIMRRGKHSRTDYVFVPWYAGSSSGGYSSGDSGGSSGGSFGGGSSGGGGASGGW